MRKIIENMINLLIAILVIPYASVILLGALFYMRAPFYILMASIGLCVGSIGLLLRKKWGAFILMVSTVPFAINGISHSSSIKNLMEPYCIVVLFILGWTIYILNKKTDTSV